MVLIRFSEFIYFRRKIEKHDANRRNCVWDKLGSINHYKQMSTKYLKFVEIIEFTVEQLIEKISLSKKLVIGEIKMIDF